MSTRNYVKPKSGILMGRKCRQWPGDQRMRMSCGHCDLDGRQWPAGTIYTPSSFGMGEVWRGERRCLEPVQRVSINGAVVRFHADGQG